MLLLPSNWLRREALLADKCWQHFSFHLFHFFFRFNFQKPGTLPLVFWTVKYTNTNLQIYKYTIWQSSRSSQHILYFWTAGCRVFLYWPMKRMWKVFFTNEKNKLQGLFSLTTEKCAGSFFIDQWKNVQDLFWPMKNVQGLVLGWGGLLATYLITSSVREYRREEISGYLSQKKTSVECWSKSDFWAECWSK